jgi:hypothetical protein
MEQDLPVWTFTLFVEGEIPPGQVPSLFARGCVLLTQRDDGRQVADFERRGGSYHEAVSAAIEALERAASGLRVVEIEGVPFPMEGFQIRTTLTREEFEGSDD